MTSAVRFVLPWCFLLVLACDEQGEGERCDLRNNNIDCESGLECVALETLGVNSPGAVCCPAQSSAGARDPVCQRRGDFGDSPPAAPTPPPSTSPGDAGDTGTATAPVDSGAKEDAATGLPDGGTTSDGSAVSSEADSAVD